MKIRDRIKDATTAGEHSPSSMAVGKIAGATGQPLSFWYETPDLSK